MRSVKPIILGLAIAASLAGLNHYRAGVIKSSPDAVPPQAQTQAPAETRSSQPAWTDEWRAEVYNAGALDRQGPHATVSTTGASGGVLLRTRLGDQTSYRVTLDGKQLLGSPASVRVLAGDAPASYFSAPPQGKLEFVARGGRDLELLLYQDSDFTYQINAVSATQCAETNCPASLPRLKENVQVRPITPADIAGVADPTQFDVELYNTPAWERRSEELSLASTAGEDGLIFKLHGLSPGDNYLLAIDGEQRQGEISVRVDKNGDEPRYYKFSDKNELRQLVFRGSDKITVTLFSSSPYSFVMKSLAAVKCDSCRGDTDLKGLIAAEIPDIEKLAKSDPLAASRELLHWTANRLTWSGNSALEVRTSQQNVVGVYFSQLEPALGGVFCGGASTLYRKVLSLFEISAVTVNFGDTRHVGKNDLTHVTTFVADSRDGKVRFYMFDPSFNAVFRDKNNKHLLDFADLVAAGRGGDISGIVTEGRSLAERRWLFKPEQATPARCQTRLRDDGKMVTCLSQNYSIDSYFFNFAHAFKELGYPLGLAGFLKMLGDEILGVDGPDTLVREFKAQARQHSVPVR